jgi:hypothetical protein
MNLNGGVPMANQTINFKSGMNLVGFTTLKNITLESLPSQVVEVSTRNIDGSYNIATKYGGVWFNSFNLEPWRAYWIKSKSNVAWTYIP